MPFWKTAGGWGVWNSVQKDYSLETRKIGGVLLCLKREIIGQVGQWNIQMLVDNLIVEGQVFTFSECKGLRCGDLVGEKNFFKMGWIFLVLWYMACTVGRARENWRRASACWE